MKIRDIVNRNIVNLTNCEQEPIHIPGSIQPFGFLLGLDDDLTIIYCSGNVIEYLGISHAQTLTKKLGDLIGNESCERFLDYVAKLNDRTNAPFILSIGASSYKCIIHRSNDTWIAEFEQDGDMSPEVSTIYDQTVQFVKYMQESATLQQLCQKVTNEIQMLTGYDRVMVYRFDKDYNGEVYAETKRDEFEPFLGLHYPHTDIPVQARELYIKNLLRIIVDINYEPVPIFTVDDGSQKNLDLSLSLLRSTSPIHVQYLHNMGVGATLTLSLLHEGKLWGLVACHHYSKKYIDHHTRINAQLQGHFLTSQISIRQMAEEYEVAREVNKSLENMLSQSFLPERKSLENIISRPALRDLCKAAGVAIVLDNRVYKNGITPPDQVIRDLAVWAAPFSRDNFFVSSKLADDYPPAGEWCQMASGVIFYTLRSLSDAAIIWFNPEVIREVNWAGDPTKAIEKNTNGLSPRKSFETWKAIIKCQARPWAAPELTAAANYAHAIQKHITLILLKEEENRQQLLTEQLKETNEELENINWISAHDLKEPLRKIQMFSSRLLEQADDKTPAIGEGLQKMNDAASRMQRLIDGLTNYAKTRHTKQLFSVLNLQEKVLRVVEEIGQDGIPGDAAIHVGSLPEINAIPVLVQQLFVNLINNALKFSKAGLPAKIEIFAQGEPSRLPNISDDKWYHKILIKDNGIGFDPERKDDIFKVFTRLNSLKLYEGSGIGLALSRKIMQIHFGYIDAINNETGGASFILYFPVENMLRVMGINDPGKIK